MDSDVHRFDGGACEMYGVEVGLVIELEIRMSITDLKMIPVHLPDRFWNKRQCRVALERRAASGHRPERVWQVHQ